MSARQWKATDGGIREFRPVVVDEEDVAVAFIPPARGDALQVQCLVAAAPDLLAALIDLLACEVKISGADATVCVRAARAAIARAEGKP